jgi:hypothetical protein
MFIESTDGKGSICSAEEHAWMMRFRKFVENIQNQGGTMQHRQVSELDMNLITHKYRIVRNNSGCYLASTRYVWNDEEFRFAIRDDGEYVRLRRDGTEFRISPSQNNVDGSGPEGRDSSNSVE